MSFTMVNLPLIQFVDFPRRGEDKLLSSMGEPYEFQSGGVGDPPGSPLAPKVPAWVMALPKHLHF